MSILPVAPRTRRILLICLIAVLGVHYALLWFEPAIGLAYSDGVALVSAKKIAAGHGYPDAANPPLFPALLALFTLISGQAQWLKSLPLLCTFGWLALTRRLLVKIRASRECAVFLVVVTAASPTVMYLATGLFSLPLFALLATASLLALLDDRPLAAGLLAGLATITQTAGMTLIIAGLLTLAANRRLRSASFFVAGAMVFAAPWFGWLLAGGRPAPHLAANEVAVLVGSNVMLLAAAPFTLMSGYANLYPGLLTAVALLIVLIRRRHFVPDLFVGLCCLMLVVRRELPLQAFATVLPLFLWMLWRVARTSRFATVSKALAILMIVPALWFGAQVVRGADKSDDWREMQKLFAFIRDNTPTDSVLLADLDPVFYLNTGRKTIRGFTPDSYRSYYAPQSMLVRPEQLRDAILQSHVTYVAVTPDRDLPESPSFHKAVEALERGGVLEPVSVPGVSGEYRLLQVTR